MAHLRNYALVGITAASLTFTVTTSGVGHAATSAIQAVFVVNTPRTAIPVITQGRTTIQGTVGISNSTTNPVAVVPQDAAPTDPFQTQLTITFPGSVRIIETQTATYTVPLGKRLIIEYLATLPSLNVSLQLPLPTLSTTVNGSTVAYPLFPTGVQQNGYEQQVRIYADGGTNVILTGSDLTDLSNPSYVSTSISGYLVNTP